MKDVVKNQDRYSGAALACAQALRSLGWSSEDIDKILAGPQRSSIHGIAGLPAEAWSVDTVEVTTVPDQTEDEQSPASSWPKDDAPAADAGIGQKELADAVWASISAGDPMPLASIARRLQKLPGPLQAYLLASSREVKRYYQDLVGWKRDFDRAQKEAEAQRGKARKEGNEAAGATVGVIAAVATAAAAANAVPVVGQVVSAVLALGLAIGTCYRAGYLMGDGAGWLMAVR